MAQYEHIRTSQRVYGHSISKISRDTGHSRITIRKALNGEFPRYPQRQQQSFPVLGPYLAVIDEWLTRDQDVPRQQRHTARRIFVRLVREYGFPGKESTVRRYVRLAKSRLGINPPQVFIPLDPVVGQEAEIDWGTAVAILGGEQVTLKMFCMRSKYSAKPFVRLYPCERQQAFFDGHIQAFAFYGGIFRLLIYDNLTSAVRQVLRGKDRVEQDQFQKFRGYYSFTARFCTPGQGHEKGGVEGLVGYARRNFLVPVPEAASLDELNERLLQECLAYGAHVVQGQDQTVAARFEAEQDHLLPLPRTPFSNLVTVGASADKFATVVIDRNRYSVPTRYVGRPLRVLCAVATVEIFCDGVRIAGHPRSFGAGKWILDPDHYLELLYQRPQAFATARPLMAWKRQWPDAMQQLWERLCADLTDNRGTREFITVLMLFRDFPAADVYAAVELAVELGVRSSAGVRQILVASHQDPPVPAPLPHWTTLPPPDLASYSALGGVA